MKRTFAALLAFLTLTGIGPPVTAAPGVRYRDEVFTKLETSKDLRYGSAVNYAGKMQQLRLDVHEPAGDRAPLRAAVVWVHGGFFVEGSKESYSEAWTQFAKAGFVTFSINYRLQDKDTFPYGAGPAVTGLRMQEYIDATRSAQQDAQAAIRWVRAHAEDYRVDPGRVAIAGHSAGGITTQMVTYNDHDPGTTGTPGYSSRPDASVSFAGTGLPFLMTRIDFLEPPMLQIHGVADDTVPFMPFNCLTAVLYLNICELVIDPDQDHGTFGYGFAREFLYRQLIVKPNVRPPTNVTPTGFP